jgi:thiamine-phosphate pyrophosphorylase
MWPPRTLAITEGRRLSTGTEQDEEARVVGFVEAMAAAGVDAVQVRERDWPDARLLRVTRAVASAVHGSACRVFVNERAHVAVAAGADGVHLRATGMPVRRVRQAWPTGLLIGRSVHVGDDPECAAGADLVMFGMVYRSGSKPADVPAAGVAALAAWSRQPGMAPVLAVGGIDVDRCLAVRDAGACGIAGIDLFTRAWRQGAAALAAVVREVHAVFRDLERAE